MPRLRLPAPAVSASAAALIVSACALAVSVYEANIFRRQQYASVWPYVEALPSYGPDYLYVEVVNKGIGPALIGRAEYRLGERRFTHPRELLHFLADTSGFPVTVSTVEGRVLAPGESIRAFDLRDPAVLERVFRQREALAGADLVIDYCSIYEDCWTVRGGEHLPR